jgi:hypothetical protein
VLRVKEQESNRVKQDERDTVMTETFESQTTSQLTLGVAGQAIHLLHYLHGELLYTPKPRFYSFRTWRFL